MRTPTRLTMLSWTEQRVQMQQRVQQKNLLAFPQYHDHGAVALAFHPRRGTKIMQLQEKKRRAKTTKKTRRTRRGRRTRMRQRRSGANGRRDRGLASMKIQSKRKAMRKSKSR